MDYQKQAEYFAAKHGVKLEILSVRYSYHFPGDKERRYVFKCKLSRNRKQYTFDFGQSINNGHKQPTMYDVLVCLQKYDVGSLEDFCGNFDYPQWDEDTGKQNKETIKTYNAVCREYESVERLFSDIMEEMQEIQ